ncbi:uncharacterized protein ACO6RY_14220 [Pungitius sinensis]
MYQHPLALRTVITPPAYHNAVQPVNT